VGSELLRGDIVDTNAAFLARQLSGIGFQVCRVEQVGDDLEDLTTAFQTAMQRAEAVLCTGGLGPTQDDLTREAIARAVGEEMYLDDLLVQEIETRFASMRRHMPASNMRQAMVIPSATAIPNPNGSAPGWYVRHNGCIVAAMPGPPSEMQPMWREWVQSRLEQLLLGSSSC
jgi:nicotinamide-nucleotide amidase